MADLTITAAQVLPVSGYRSETRVAGATITAGQAVYRDSSQTWQLADGDAALTAAAAGIALNGASAGQPCQVQTGGTITLGAGAAPVVGETYCASLTAGGIAPDADILTGDFKTILGIGIGSDQVKLGILVSGVASA